MSDEMTMVPGKLVGFDLTVPDADGIRDFYKAVIGWDSAGMDMGGYEDYFMNLPGTGETVAGVCHTRGSNADLPPVWMVYVAVADIEASLTSVTNLGGKALTPIKGGPGDGRYCVIQDPAGAILALMAV
ncbi:MAG: VOC family protein [Thermomicrobiales bacterium]